MKEYLDDHEPGGLARPHEFGASPFVVDRRAEAEIEATVVDDNVVPMDFLFGNAVGWIKVQVREQDVDAPSPVSEDEIPWDSEETKKLSEASVRRSSLAFLINIFSILTFTWVWIGFGTWLF